MCFIAICIVNSYYVVIGSWYTNCDSEITWFFAFVYAYRQTGAWLRQDFTRRVWFLLGLDRNRILRWFDVYAVRMLAYLWTES